MFGAGTIREEEIGFGFASERMCFGVCVCVRKRERERERVCFCECVFESVYLVHV